MESFLEKIGQIAIFMICAQTLMHFRAKEAYEKYLKLLVSMMLLLLLAEPLLGLMGKGMRCAMCRLICIRARVLRSSASPVRASRSLSRASWVCWTPTVGWTAARSSTMART